MKVLGVDYGRRKIGLAINGGKLASPLKVIHYKFVKDALEELEAVAVSEEIEKLVIGISEGEMAIEAKNFGNILSKKVKLPIVFVDETLTSEDAKFMAQEAGIQRSRRRRMEDAYAAALILQSYLDRVK